MRAMLIAAVTLVFAWLLGASVFHQGARAALGGSAVLFFGWSGYLLYSRYSHDEARRVRAEREDKGMCLRCGYNLAGNLTGVCPECGEGDRMDRSMIPYREPLVALESLYARVTRFRDLPFPTDWAKIVNGVGLASFTMRAERALDRLSQLPHLCEYKFSYLRTVGEPKATAAALHAELHPLLGEFERFLPALPPEAQAYFTDLRSLVTDAVALAERWWAITGEVESIQPV